MKNTVKFLSIFILFSCSPSEEELKIAVDEIYNQVKTIPSSKPCENLDGYKNLEAYESRYKSNFYSELTSQKIKLYEEECSKKIIADEKEKQRKAELRKLGSWSTGNYVDEFGDNTGEGFIQLTTYGYFSNSATTDSRLRVVMMLSDGKIDKPWFRFYEYDGKNAVKGVFSDANPIRCRVKGSNGSNTFPIGLYQGQGGDYLLIDASKKKDADVQKLRNLIQDEDIAKFSCYRERYSSDKYRFDLNFKYLSNAQKKYELGSDWYDQ